MLRIGKKLAAVGVMSLVLALVLIACGGDDPTPTPKPAATATPVPAPTATPKPGVTPDPTATPTPAPEEPEFDAEAYFKGKTIRIMVGFNPGGGTDAQARYMSKAWPEFIPGKPRIVVTNMTPVLTERNFVWNSKPDGLTLAVEATPGIFDMTAPGAQFDMREVTMIGVTSGREGLWVINGEMGYDCFESAWGGSETLTIGQSAPTPADLGSYGVLGWLADEFNVPLEIRNVAAAGSAEQYLMMERGDVNSWLSGTLWDQFPRTRPDWLPNGFIRPFADMSVPGFDLGNNGQMDFHCPNVADAHLDEAQTAIYNAFRGPQIYAAKNVVGPPGMEKGVANALRTALADAMNDEKFASDMQGFTGIKNNFSGGEAAQQQLIETTQAFLDKKDDVDKIIEAVHAKYVK